MYINFISIYNNYITFIVNMSIFIYHYLKTDAFLKKKNILKHFFKKKKIPNWADLTSPRVNLGCR